MATSTDWVSQPEMSDAAVVRATGKTWDAWIEILDHWGAQERSHKEIAAWIGAEYGISGWWAQSVTVGYERIRGMRKVNQRPDGFSMSASKTVPLPASDLLQMFVDDAKRDEWLGGGVLTLRTSRSPKSARFDVLDGGGILAATFVDKGDKAAVQIQINQIESEEAMTRQKAIWKVRLGILAAYVRDKELTPEMRSLRDTL